MADKKKNTAPEKDVKVGNDAPALEATAIEQDGANPTTDSTDSTPNKNKSKQKQSEANGDDAEIEKIEALEEDIDDEMPEAYDIPRDPVTGKPIVNLAPATIVSVLTQSQDGYYADSIMVKFEHKYAIYEEDFGSPILNAENMLMWRRIMLGVITGEGKINSKDRRLMGFENYKNAIEQQEVLVAFDDAEVIAIGKDHKHLFNPYEYNIWS